MSGCEFYYVAFGMIIRSNRPVSGLRMIEPQPSALELDFQGCPEFTDHLPRSSPVYHEGIEALWRLDDGSWVVKFTEPGGEASLTMTFSGDGSKMTLRWTQDATVEDIDPVIQSTGLPVALHMRGIPLLHAAGIAIDDRAILVMGVPGAGKSTLAAAFLRQGFELLCDDVAALDERADGFWAQPGHPRLRIALETGLAIGWCADELQRVWTAAFHDDKRYVDLSTGPHRVLARPMAIASIYVLQHRTRRAATVIRPVEALEALPTLMENTFAARYLDRGRRDRIFRTCGRLANSVPVRLVEAPDSIEYLPSLVDAIVSDSARRDVGP